MLSSIHPNSNSNWKLKIEIKNENSKFDFIIPFWITTLIQISDNRPHIKKMEYILTNDWICDIIYITK